MKTFLAIFTITLIISGISHVEGGHQLGNFMKFLRNMKSKGWDKNLILARQQTFKTSDNFKDVYIPKFDSAKEHLILKESGKVNRFYCCKNYESYIQNCRLTVWGLGGPCNPSYWEDGV